MGAQIYLESQASSERRLPHFIFPLAVQCLLNDMDSLPYAGAGAISSSAGEQATKLPAFDDTLGALVIGTFVGLMWVLEPISDRSTFFTQ